MPKPQTRWTFPEIKKLGELAASGMSGPNMGVELGRTRCSVIGKCKELGFRVKRGGGLPKITAADRAMWGSDDLRDAISALLGRMDHATITACLCPQAPTIPGTERVYKTASIERLAA